MRDMTPDEMEQSTNDFTRDDQIDAVLCVATMSGLAIIVNV
jgi:hypothetical protein